MFDKIFDLILIFITLSQSITGIKNETSECVISNQKYLYEYLLNADLDDEVYSARINKIKNLNEMKWMFEKKSELNHTYYIKSSLNNQYLCALMGFVDVFSLRKSVVFRDIESLKYKFTEYKSFERFFKRCEWGVDKIKKDQK